MEIHVVAPGETVFSIAALYGVSEQSIIYNNELPSGQPLAVGQALVILFPEQVHTVAPGDTLNSIAAQYGVSINTLFRNNFRLAGRYTIYSGETIVISYRDVKLGTMEVNAYAYPWINRSLLRQTLPYLTRVSDTAARRHRLARHSAKRVTQLSAE